MPIFEYRCEECGHQFERIVFRSDVDVSCPICRSERTEKLVSSFAMSGASQKSAGSGAACGPGKFT